MNTFLLFLAGLSASVYAQCVENDALDNPDWDRVLQDFQKGSMEFGLEMFRNLNSYDRNDTTNLFFSPLSIWSALSVLSLGARGQTTIELETVLGLNAIKKSVLPKIFDKFLEICSQCGNDERSSFSLANRIYIDENIQIRLCEERLKGILMKTDFQKDPEGSRNEINKWVEERTRGKIRDLIPASAVSPDTQVIIANAVYFKENWRTEFNREMTRSTRFYMNSDINYRVNMMNTHDTFLYGVSDEMNCQGVEIPYNGDELSMMILLPLHPYNGFEILAKSITGNRLMKLIDSMGPRKLWVAIPKFKVEQQFELSKVLDRMGLRDVFDPKYTDLSGFTGNRDLSVDSVYHKSYIKVNEEGTEAAAATSVLLSRDARPTGITRFVADKPFMYLIRHVRSNVILFMGTIKSPKYE